jgi:hypothetical protein
MMIWVEIEWAMFTTTSAVGMVDQEFALVVNQVDTPIVETRQPLATVDVAVSDGDIPRDPA